MNSDTRELLAKLCSKLLFAFIIAFAVVTFFAGWFGGLHLFTTGHILAGCACITYSLFVAIAALLIFIF